MRDNTMPMYIVVLSGRGGLREGYRFFGPYTSYVEACDEAKTAKETWEVVTLHPPFWNCADNKKKEEQNAEHSQNN